MAQIDVEVAYATPEEQTLLVVKLNEGSTAADAVERSAVLQRHPEIVWPGTPLGIFGRKVEPDTILREGDRVEIYRPLSRDPKTRRRERAAGS